MNNTIDFYNKNAENFKENTISVDMKSIEDEFISFLENGAKILDLGCGTGRDGKYFLSKGFSVTLTDGSIEMCKIAEENTGLKARHLLFEDLDYINEFDGVWACSSLLHIPSNNLHIIMKSIHRALRENGVFYFSFKYGKGEGNKNGRFFLNLTEETMKDYIDGLFNVRKVWITNDVRPERIEERWLNVIAKKE